MRYICASIGLAEARSLVLVKAFYFEIDSQRSTRDLKFMILRIVTSDKPHNINDYFITMLMDIKTLNRPLNQ